ncbi:hypothetical protein SPD48_11115 [Pseudogracilibacillus sp. SE30717A]
MTIYNGEYRVIGDVPFDYGEWNIHIGGGAILTAEQINLSAVNNL